MVLLECSITSILAIVIVRSIVIVRYVQSYSEFDHWRICHAFYQIAWNFVTSLISSNMFFFCFPENWAFLIYLKFDCSILSFQRSRIPRNLPPFSSSPSAPHSRCWSLGALRKTARIFGCSFRFYKYVTNSVYIAEYSWIWISSCLYFPIVCRVILLQVNWDGSFYDLVLKRFKIFGGFNLLLIFWVKRYIFFTVFFEKAKKLKNIWLCYVVRTFLLI